MAYINYKNLSLPKLNSDPNHWADHIEFLCFLSADAYASEKLICDRVLDENSNDATIAINDLAEEEEITELVEELTNTTPIADDEIINDSQNNSALTDKISSKIKALFDVMSARQIHYGDDYPFYVTKNEILLKDDLSITQSTYIILLLSSLLRLATKSGINKLGHLFEKLCGPVFNMLIPNNSSAYFFGSGSGEKSEFKGKFYDKVIELCGKLHVKHGSNFTPENAGIHDVGDGGLDWVGVFDFIDLQSSQPVFFGQCACGTSDWIDKEFDTHISKWRNYIQFTNGYLTYHFIPRNFRDNSLLWFNPLDILDVVLIDRYRILELLKKTKNLDEIISIYIPLFEEMTKNKIDAFM
ncbi:MAG: hypothetical protein ABI091_22760 [Ferruginibacter sp.]